MNRRDIAIYGSIIGGTALLTSVLGMWAHKAGQIYHSMNPPSVTSPAPEEAKKPKFAYARNLSEELVNAVRTLDNVYRTQHGKGLQVFHVGPQNEHYVVIRGTGEETIAEAYLKASRWGIIDHNTPIRLVLGSASPDIPKMPLLLTESPDIAYDELVDDKRHGAYRSVASSQPLFPQMPEQEGSLRQRAEKGLEMIIGAVEEETRKLAVKK